MVSKNKIRQLSNSCNTAFSIPGIGRMKKIYCKCGRISEMDSSKMALKLRLGKPLECEVCRNARIAEDIKTLDMQFGEYAEEEY